MTRATRWKDSSLYWLKAVRGAIYLSKCRSSHDHVLGKLFKLSKLKIFPNNGDINITFLVIIRTKSSYLYNIPRLCVSHTKFFVQVRCC